MATHMTLRTCPICGQEVAPGTRAMYVGPAKVLNGWRSEHRLARCEGGQQPRYLIHLECWERVLNGDTQATSAPTERR